ncbi:hypothetical protein PG985_015125 [Apiospora marii]|uniref:Uncharacterized protein n=1 Tax=Apiospora marii TaxID=335849 RepID=A0ABR1RLY2_9PEZI
MGSITPGEITLGDMMVLDRVWDIFEYIEIDWKRYARLARFRSPDAARAFHATLGEDKPGGNFQVTRLDIATLEKLFDVISEIRVDWARLADRSNIGDIEATKTIFPELADFEAEMSWDTESCDSIPVPVKKVSKRAWL